jgi:hypothetical protein
LILQHPIGLVGEVDWPKLKPGLKRHTNLLAGSLYALLVSAAQTYAQVIPPQAIEQFQDVIGSRVEAVTILGGDYGAAGGIYTFRGGKVAELNVSKIGGGGNIAAIRPLGDTCFRWAPVLQGNIGYISAENQFPGGYLEGNKSIYDVFALQGGAGARFYFTDHLSLAPTLSGIYGYTENNFEPQNAIGEAIKAAASGTYVDWHLQTWSVMPSLEGRYEWLWGRTAFQLSSRYTFFHTESFQSSSPVVSVNGDSEVWENRLDVDIPIRWRMFGRELHTGGFFSRTELFGNAAQGLNADHFYTANGRLVLDLKGKVWKLRWLGIGASYFFGDAFDGWSAGVDVRFEF